MANSPPLCISFVICDGVILDPVSRKRTYVGVMDELRPAMLPAAYPRVTVVAALTNLRGSYRMAVSCRHEETGDIVTQTSQDRERLSCDNPHGLITVEAVVRNLTFRHFGPYRFSLLLNGSIIAERRFLVFRPPARDVPLSAAEPRNGPPPAPPSEPPSEPPTSAGDEPKSDAA